MLPVWFLIFFAVGGVLALMFSERERKPKVRAKPQPKRDPLAEKPKTVANLRAAGYHFVEPDEIPDYKSEEVPF